MIASEGGIVQTVVPLPRQPLLCQERAQIPPTAADFYPPEAEGMELADGARTLAPSRRGVLKAADHMGRAPETLNLLRWRGARTRISRGDLSKGAGRRTSSAAEEAAWMAMRWKPKPGPISLLLLQARGLATHLATTRLAHGQ